MAFGGSLNDSGDMVSDINMVPLIDVMLVLLIIFILTVPVLTHSVKLDLPRASNEAQKIEPDTVNLSITQEGTVFWNEDLLDEEHLSQRLAEAATREPQPEIFIRGDRKVEYEHVIQVMAAVQRAGLLKLGFITDPGGN